MRLMSTCVLIYAMYSLQRWLPCIFVINVVTSTSMQTRLRNVADFSPCSAVILMPCKHDATKRSMHILRYFSKDVLNIWLWSIHSCPCLQLWSSLACHFRALLLLQNVSWQIVYMLFNFAAVVVVDPWMLWTCSCLGLFHKHVFLMMLCLSCILVVSESSLISRVLAVDVLLGWICYFVMVCKPASTNHSMHNLVMFTKGVLFCMSCSIHPCPWLQL